MKRKFWVEKIDFTETDWTGLIDGNERLDRDVKQRMETTFIKILETEKIQIFRNGAHNKSFPNTFKLRNRT